MTMTDESIRAAIKHLKVGSVIDVTWKMPGNCEQQTWRGSITRQGGRGSSIEYFAEEGITWEKVRTDSILPNPEIEVTNITILTAVEEKQQTPPREQQKKQPPKAKKQQQQQQNSRPKKRMRL